MIKSPRLLTVIALAGLTGLQPLHAQLNVPSDGSDGVLNITTNTVIDLSLATTGVWSQNNTANAGNGVYDPEKWAVVFKYSSVSIASNATVTFANHASHAPVVWLVQSNATVNGTLSVDGKSGAYSYPDNLFPTEPGPGGFRGGATGPVGDASGFGPGGLRSGRGGSASYSGSYGNPQILPLIGGSGASANDLAFNSSAKGSGASGGGAVMVVVGGVLSLNGAMTADGNVMHYNNYGSDVPTYSSGGAIRIIANQFIGKGRMSASRVRVEANTVSPLLIFNPNTTTVPPGTTPTIWPPSVTPTVRVLSVNASPTPNDPLAGILTSSDLAIGTNAPVTILVETRNFPPSGLVEVRINPKYGSYFTTIATNISGTFSNALWRTGATFPNGFCTLQARATSP